jgi:hypothetical protein
MALPSARFNVKLLGASAAYSVLAATPATCLSHTCGVSLEVTGVWPRLRGEGSKVVRVGGARPLMKAPWEFRFAME